MISLPDFKEKQILVVNAEWGSRPSLKFQNDNIVFSKNGKVVNRASCHKVFALFVAGDISLSSGLLKKGREHGVSIFLAKHNFEVYAALSAFAAGNYLLRQKQYTLSKEEELKIAKYIVKNKIGNQFSLLKGSKLLASKEADVAQKEIAKQIDEVLDDQSLLGIEGNMSRRFYGMYFGEIGWLRRSPRAKQDIPNFLMDMGYTFLFNMIDGLLSLHGFDTYKGCYHKLFFQRKSLACDAMEPFRCVIDKQIQKSYNLKQVNEKDFRIVQGKYVLDLSKNTKYAQLFAEAIMGNKEDLFTFIREYYRFVMDPANPFPIFDIKVK
ncbi:MAG: hypothetical protein COZ49_03360 [Candidatus Yonathbacteria bacterium CG_4_10_14_3_um_filter_47_65]|uniref:CRISPR-associated endonuclease Cas1 n=1 Tax=Candidatus Yonathbacteria bacterium CG_4_9_14_0_8_um_filter_46_47 TaxID=1975106 RepID=A0A2M8D6Q8_9BACT|nr:MAG: hypothetical protein COX54_02635 [Candidatus Yonathbacteria bacterium CG23_combo_of_CG06-09_8_20_14_all_46_18]PIX56217.1 MAG: hypothetical protein COZ49_03360 [Candidatus Yonathbacteria bacterium CG_4_10_14_3_um_filter_47_65]PJB82687.1 MAG: hypothetical protein CO088_02985 [Candidatus Yonathbacteria bacterium CG_4_9_14_0_8_um_filter_46_47]PJC19761.1 MAG: hypothetical protein CO061_04365 [Candidatus Yonathbacteria bacterium CG_4_9_14_0_2_um_filter_47_74]PJC67722.1 MAG: hypothetical prote